MDTTPTHLKSPDVRLQLESQRAGNACGHIVPTDAEQERQALSAAERRMDFIPHILADLLGRAGRIARQAKHGYFQRCKHVRRFKVPNLFELLS